MSARTRRQKAALAAEESEDSPGNGAVSTPSKRTPSKKRARSAAREERKENIFLFTPNLIGMIKLRLQSYYCYRLSDLTRFQDTPESC